MLDNLVGDDGDRFSCKAVRMGSKIVPKTKNMNQKYGTEENPVWAHITLTRDVAGVKVIQKGDKLLLL